MSKILLIGLAGFLATLSRYWMSDVVAKRYGETFPMGTLVVNLMVLIGFLGGFTTFSSFGLQTFTLLQDGEFGLAVLNLTASNVVGLFLVWAGYSLARIL